MNKTVACRVVKASRGWGELGRKQSRRKSLGSGCGEASSYIRVRPIKRVRVAGLGFVMRVVPRSNSMSFVP